MRHRWYPGGIRGRGCMPQRSRNLHRPSPDGESPPSADRLGRTPDAPPPRDVGTLPRRTPTRGETIATVTRGADSGGVASRDPVHALRRAHARVGHVRTVLRGDRRTPRAGRRLRQLDPGSRETPRRDPPARPPGFSPPPVLRTGKPGAGSHELTDPVVGEPLHLPPRSPPDRTGSPEAPVRPRSPSNRARGART